MTSEQLERIRKTINDPFMGWPREHFVHALVAEIDGARAEARHWRWVPETLAGQTFENENVAHAYLRDEFKNLRKCMAIAKGALEWISSLNSRSSDSKELRRQDVVQAIKALGEIATIQAVCPTTQRIKGD